MASNFSWDTFETATDESSKAAASPSNQEGGFWGQFEETDEDSFGKSIARTAVQPALGAAKVTPYGIATSIFDLLAAGEGLAGIEEMDEPRIAELKQKFPTAPWEQFQGVDKEKSGEALAAARSIIPTVENIQGFLEKHTGLPLEAKNKLQKFLNLAGSGAKFKTGGVGEKALSGVIAGTGGKILKDIGIPEPIADAAALAISGVAPKPGVSKVLKPSGTPQRRFEGVTKPRTITKAQGKQVRSAVEKDVRGATNKLIQETSKTARALEQDPSFGRKVDALFGDVEKAASELSGDFIDGSKIRSVVRNKMERKPEKGISLDEFEKSYRNEMKSQYKGISPYEEFNVPQLLEQYRKNNKALSEFYEPGKSSAANRGKKEALLDYNRAIADLFEKKYPDSEFNKLFKFTNKRYSEIRDLDQIDSFFDKVFDEKINYKQAQRFFKDKRTNQAFKRTLGEEGYKEVEGIMNDFLPTEKAMRNLKEAEALGVKGMAKLGGKWLVSPLWAKASAAASGTKFIRNSLLSSPKFRTTWKSALDSFKAKDYAKASIALNALEDMEKESKE